MVPVMYLPRPPWILLRERRHRDERGVVVVLARRRLPLAREHADDGERRRCRCAPSGRSGSRVAPKSCSTTVCPRTTTLAPPSTSACVKTAPERDGPAADVEVVGRRAGDAVRPVQLVADDGLVAIEAAGAAAFTVGHLGCGWPRDRPTSASACVPKPPNEPPAVVEPGRTMSRFVPIAANACSTCALRARADRHHGDDGGDADDDAERREERAHLVAQHARASATRSV